MVVFLSQGLFVEYCVGSFPGNAFGEEPFKAHAEMAPFVFCHHKVPVARGFQTSYLSVFQAKVVQRSAQSASHPKRPHSAPKILEDENPPSFLLEKTGGFHHAHNGFIGLVAVHVARAEAVDGEGKYPFFASRVGGQCQVVQAVVHLFQPKSLRPAVDGCQACCDDHGEQPTADS